MKHLLLLVDIGVEDIHLGRQFQEALPMGREGRENQERRSITKCVINSRAIGGMHHLTPLESL